LIQNLFYHHLSMSFLICMIFTGIFFPKNASPGAEQTYYTISGKIEFFERRCVGIVTVFDTGSKHPDKKPLAGYKLYLREGNTNHLNAPIIASTITNDAGQFFFRVPAGNYVLLSEDQVDRARIRACLHDKDIKIKRFDCLEAWWQKGLAQVNVDDQSPDDLYFHWYKDCYLPLAVPCIEYTGARYQ
ncbi:MAG: carboxypeptidase-like regulatory domain-containing protein, partial [Bacteroidota bacterium]